MKLLASGTRTDFPGWGKGFEEALERKEGGGAHPGGGSTSTGTQYPLGNAVH